MLNFNLDKELVSTDIKDKHYLLEQEYKKKGIPYSPYLMYEPEEVKKKRRSKKKRKRI